MPAPELTVQWCRDGTEIPARPVPSIAGSCGRPHAADLPGQRREPSRHRQAETAALAITHVAPEPVGVIFEEIYDQHSDVQTLEAKEYFRGEDLRQR